MPMCPFNVGGPVFDSIESMVGMAAATLPWLETVSGFSLILGFILGGCRFANLVPIGGVLRRSALLLILSQSLLFVVVLVITLARGLKIDCGCVLFTDRQVSPGAILEDTVLLGVLGWLYSRECRAGCQEI